MGQQDHDTDPSPAEIQQACQSIQSGWTEREEHRRRTGLAEPVRYEISEIVAPRNRLGQLIG